MVQKQICRNTSQDDMSTRRFWLKREDTIKVDLKLGVNVQMGFNWFAIGFSGLLSTQLSA